jgi:hypothetical protein
VPRSWLTHQAPISAREIGAKSINRPVTARPRLDTRQCHGTHIEGNKTMVTARSNLPAHRRTSSIRPRPKTRKGSDRLHA